MRDPLSDHELDHVYPPEVGEEVRRLRAERADLLKALQIIVRRLDNGDTIDGDWYEVQIGREAIAKAESRSHP